MAVGRADEAIAMVKTAHRMDPLSSVLSASLGMILYLARRCEESLAYLRKALEVDQNHFLLHLRVGLVHTQTDSSQQAIDEMKQSVELSGRSTETLTGLAHAYAASGMRRKMQAILGELRDQTVHRYVSPYNVARVFAAAGERESAFGWLATAYDERNPDLIELGAEPVFDGLRTDPRFTDLLHRVAGRR